ncbi:hypothetical protein B9T11_03390 [Wohlfahrtiimonas chitiniclastica]|uniref:hypothetical protein n=1 Tax=Wohlfahrtiimonas chitiniclastica TaxID=400946 RepID=UPI000B995766|nr:hypothetical protein [Wohlfahrtiimonas chitiniclastica]OYQ70655.1 hypothetical protein B9T13_05170 [Wohlfahrtiimonas chitiniclastica]OYQ82062.1 hypothetical protein B9T11_03390 [Wohlfahrtiimonas chitiniclastica]OYQ83860.1 hypothetical protein B9T14_06465 [Wohlfahrtiimonas chitiniclastica]OYQ84699.1 hypothetical protein B9T15_06495 [Wohlfahrtiimonas chitiniclastica]
MKKLLCLSSLMFALSVAHAQESSFTEDFSKLTDDVSKSVKKGWDKSKDALSDFSDDAKVQLDKAGESIKSSFDDFKNSYAVTDAATLKKYLVVEIPAVSLEDEHLTVTVLLKNNQDKPVKFKDLKNKVDVIVLDQDSIAYFATEASLQHNNKIIVPAKAAVKVTWQFDNVATTPVTLRLMNADYPLPKISSGFSLKSLGL